GLFEDRGDSSIGLDGTFRLDALQNRGAGEQRRLSPRPLRDRHRQTRSPSGATVQADAAVELYHGHSARPPLGQRFRDRSEGAPPADPKSAWHRAQSREVISGSLRDPVEGGALVIRYRNHESIRQLVSFDEFALQPEASSTGMHDLDPHDALLPSVREKPPDLPARDLQKGADLILRLRFVVVQLSDAHSEQVFVHGILPSPQEYSRSPSCAHFCSHADSLGA